MFVTLSLQGNWSVEGSNLSPEKFFQVFTPKLEDYIEKIGITKLIDEKGSDMISSPLTILFFHKYYDYCIMNIYDE